MQTEIITITDVKAQREELARAGKVLRGGGLADKAMIVMKSADLQSLPRLFGLSRHTLRLMRRNFFRTMAFHLAGVLVAAGILYPVYGILLTPILAVTVIALSCIMPVKG